MTHPFQWTLYIGPAWHPESSNYFLDWTGIAADGAFDLDLQTTLASTLNSGATTVSLVDASKVVTTGGVWIGPNGSGQGWEYVEYTGKSGNDLLNAVREPPADREHNGVHSAGAVVRSWWKVSGNDGRLRANMSLDDLLVATDWQFEVSGIAGPQVAFRPFHFAVVQYRQAVTGNLLTMFTGFLDTSTIRDDARKVRNWSAKAGSIALILRRIQVRGIRVGNFDAAVHGSAASSTPLGAAHKERWSGDFIAANPSFDPNVLLEEDGDGIWINDRMVGTKESPGSYQGFSQIYINPPNSVNGGTRWIEIIGRDTASMDIVAWNRDTNSEWPLDIPSVNLSGGKRMIIAESAFRFQEENPSQVADRIYDVSASDMNPTWFNNIKPQGGAIALKSFGNYYHAVYWGDVDQSDTGWAPDGWTGSPMPAPKADETMRWKANDSGHVNTKDDWEVSRRQSPGYMIEPNDDDGSQAWVTVDLPGMGLVLHEDITPTSPDVLDILYIDGQNGPSTDGLPSSGTLVIGDEHISYSSKTYRGVIVTARGANSTTADYHAAGDAVFLLFSQGGRTMVTDALPLKSLTWERYGGTIYPADFKWRYSALPARKPGEPQNELDYEVTNTITGHTNSSHTQSLSNNRARTVLLEIQKMTTDPARPRLNRIKILVDPAYFTSTYWLASGQTVEQLIWQIGRNAGLSSTLITAAGGGAAPGGFMTAIDNAWSVMTSAAEMGGSQVIVTRDSKVQVAPDTFWMAAVGGYTPVATWDADDISSVELIRTGGGYVSQVRITWQKPDGSDGGLAVYPATPNELGKPLELGTMYFADKTAAELAARKRYYLTRYPYELAVTLASGNLSIQPRQIHRIQWQLDSDMQPMDRLVLVTSVSHSVENQTLNTLFTGIVIDRESDG